MKIVLPGGSGQLGRILVRGLTREGHECVVLARDPARVEAALARAGLGGAARAVSWDGASPGAWRAELEGADAVIDLAGRSVDCRYTGRNLAVMRASRVDSTRAVGAAIAAARTPPRVWLNASTATIYAHAAPGDPARDEASGPIGGAEPGVPALWARSVEIALAWERELFAADTPRTRRVALRGAMVMAAARGGVFDAFAGLCRLGFGRHGTGEQFVSWIHEEDFAAAVRFLLTHDGIEGPVNLAAPGPLPNRDFVAAIHAALGSRVSVPVPARLLELGACLRRTETELLLKSRRVVPAKLQAAGFRFRHPEWGAATRELTERWRRSVLPPSRGGGA
jgi:uncharacterized protein (TIGR01777 family)